MVTKDSPSPSPVQDEQPAVQEQPGFFDLLIKSVFEPGANSAVVMAMNLCFFFLILTLFALAFLTGWNKHVLMLLGVSALLWGSMAWFVLELTRVQTLPNNMPPALDADVDGGSGAAGEAVVLEAPIAEARKER
ncbi:hypothetical protein IAT38_006675 [Cryptococcus sp. DSM 104549]